MPVSQTLTPSPGFGHRGVDAKDTFVSKQEAGQDHLSDTFIGEFNTAIGQLNTLEENVNAKEASAVQASLDAISAKDAVYASANFKGIYSPSTTYLLKETVEYNGQVFMALQTTLGNTPAIGSAYWVVITLNINGQTNKTTPVSADEVLIADSESGFSFKKLALSALNALFQPLLVSGTNIKTVGGTSLLGSGDLTPTDNTKLPLSGGTMTGAITAIRETKVAMAASNIDLATGNVFTKTISANTTFTKTNALASGNVNEFILELTFGATMYTITWTSLGSVKWAGGVVPTFSINTVNILGFYSHDGGTTWRGIVLAKDSK